MNILILGGTGYLGNKIINVLLDNGYNVYCLIRNESNIKKIEGKSGKLFHWKITDLGENLNKIDFSIDCLINTACQYLKDDINQLEVVEANLSVPLAVFLQCIEFGITRYITIGTGLPDRFNLYSFTKSSFANICKWYINSSCCMKRIEFCNVELENFYGPDEPKNRFIPSIIEKMKTNQIILLTDGTQHRDFIYIDDVVDAIIRLIEIKKLPVYMNLPLGSGDGPSIREVVEYLHDIIDTNSELRFGAISKRIDEPDSIADIGLMSLLDIKIKYSWREGMMRLI